MGRTDNGIQTAPGVRPCCALINGIIFKKIFENLMELKRHNQVLLRD